MATEKTLADAFHETLKDVYFAEKKSVQALKKSAKAAQSDELKEAFLKHADESQNQVERLTQVFEIIGKAPRAKTCEAMQGIAAEMEEDLEEFGDTDAADHVLIGCAQAVEHYEIARYGLLKAWAGKLGYDEAVTRDEFERLRADLKAKMPEAVRDQIPELADQKPEAKSEVLQAADRLNITDDMLPAEPESKAAALTLGG